MFTRSLGLFVLVFLLGTATVSAQDDGGSSLQWWADSYSTALDISPQIEWPRSDRTTPGVVIYDAADAVTPTCSAGHSHSVWHTFVPTQSGQIVIYVLGNNFDTVAAVYKNTPTTANQIRCINPSSSSSIWEFGTVNVKAGTRYYVLFASTGGGPTVDGTSQFSHLYYGNNARTSAYQIPGSGVYNNVQDHIEQAFSSYITSGSCNNQNRSVFYKFRPTVSGRYEFSTNGSNYDTVIRIDDGASFSACNEDRNINDFTSRLRVDLSAGTTYYLSIGQTSIANPVLTDNMVLSLRVRRL